MRNSLASELNETENLLDQKTLTSSIELYINVHAAGATNKFVGENILSNNAGSLSAASEIYIVVKTLMCASAIEWWRNES